MASPIPPGLTLILGPMFAGKTTAAAELVTEKTLIIVPDRDTRNGSNLRTHDGNAIGATAVRDLESVAPGIDVNRVIIDEAQFFDDLDPVLDWCQTHHVVVAGLVSDFNMEPFGKIPTLIHAADEIRHLRARCGMCGDNASFSKLLGASPVQIVPGGSDKYQAVCRKCLG